MISVFRRLYLKSHIYLFQRTYLIVVHIFLSALSKSFFQMICLSLTQNSRELTRDLQIQLDQVLQQAHNPNSKGNSLFAEVKKTIEK